MLRNSSQSGMWYPPVVLYCHKNIFSYRRIYGEIFVELWIKTKNVRIVSSTENAIICDVTVEVVS